MTEKLKKCFVICPIGADGSPERQHSDDVLEFIINPVITKMGFIGGERADHLRMPGDIPRQILDRIANDDLVIADLTGHNPNVFYELAIRHAVRKPYIHLIKKGEKIPFDVAPQRTVFIEPVSPREIEKAKAELRSHVETCMASGFVVESPLSHAINIDRLGEGDPVARSLKMLTDQVEWLVQQQKKSDWEAELKRIESDPPPRVVPLSYSHVVESGLDYSALLEGQVDQFVRRRGLARPSQAVMDAIEEILAAKITSPSGLSPAQLNGIVTELLEKWAAE